MSVTGVELTKLFAGIRVLDRVGITLGDGEIHGLLGANGSGKSTLVKILTGVYQPDHGEIQVGLAKMPAIESPHVANQLGIAVVHQEAPLVDTMTVGEGIALFRGYPMSGGRVDWKRLYSDTAAMLARYEVEIDPRRLAGLLSPAERALVALAIALDGVRTGLQLLVLDEATASLPETQAGIFLDRVSRIAESGTAVLMVTHRLKELHGRAQRVTVLRDGRVVHAAEQGAINDVELMRLMTGPRDTPAVPGTETSGGSIARLWAAQGSSRATQPALGETVLEARNLGGSTLRDASFSLRAGEIVGVAGLMDSGIGELPQILGGAVPRRKGTLVLGERALPLAMRPWHAIDAGICLLPVDRLRSGGVGSLSIAENVSLPRFGAYWHGRARERRVVDQLIAELDVRPPVPSTLFGKLSGGNQQKVLLGKWLLLRPKVLVLEDPTSGVDPNARERMFDILRQTAAEGVAVLFLSTEPEQLATMCSRVLILRDGLLKAELNGAEIEQEAISQWCYA